MRYWQRVALSLLDEKCLQRAELDNLEHPSKETFDSGLALCCELELGAGKQVGKRTPQ